MGLVARLRTAIDGLPEEGSVTFPVSWLREQLEDDARPDQPHHLAGYTVAELAEELGSAQSTVRDWLNRGDFPGAYKLGRAWRIPRADVRAFIERARCGEEPTRARASSTKPTDLSAWRKGRRTG